jgi:hypothetical protein
MLSTAYTWPFASARPAEVDPSVDGISALVKHLAGFGVESVEHGALGVFLALRIVRAWFASGAKSSHLRGFGSLLAVGQCEYHSVGNHHRLGTLKSPEIHAGSRIGLLSLPPTLKAMMLPLGWARSSSGTLGRAWKRPPHGNVDPRVPFVVLPGRETAPDSCSLKRIFIVAEPRRGKERSMVILPAEFAASIK